MGIFTEDLEAGELVEQEVAARLEKFWYPRGYLPLLKEHEKGHDIKLIHPSGRSVLIEVKFDRESERTGNMAIEFQCSGQWSGIATTRADFWVFKYWDQAALDTHGDWQFCAVPRHTLIKEWRSRRYPAVYGGDNMRARMILVPVRTFSTWGIPL